jgi:hypothetical protein
VIGKSTGNGNKSQQVNTVLSSPFAVVTLKHGATQDRDLFDWFQDVAYTASGLGLVDNL